MKKVSFFAVMLLALSGCVNNLDLEESDGLVGRPLTIRATLGDTGTKTVLQSDGVYWLDGDAINMFYGSKFSGRFVTELAAPDKTAEFNGQLSVVTGSTNEGMEASDFWAVYPYDAANTCDGTGVTLTIPAAQPGVAGTFAPNLNPTVATSPGLDLAFYNVGSWLLFSVAQEGITSATLRGNGGENLAGKVRVTMDADGHPVSTVVAGAQAITITPEGGSFIPGEFYYIVLIPQTLSQGFALTLNKGAFTADKVVSANLTFPRNTPLQLSKPVDNGLDFVIVNQDDPIGFADQNVKAICIANWDTNNDGELSYAEAAAVTDIPSTIFAENTTITSFDEFQYFTGLTTINHDSFSNCSGLQSVTLPSGITYIDFGAFINCTSLTNIIIPEGVTTIENFAFSGCSGLASVVFPQTMEWICAGAFMNCTSLTSVEIWGNIRGRVFEGCTSLTDVTISESVSSIEEEAFSGCSNLANVIVNTISPPELYGSPFPVGVVVYVPSEALNTYRNTPGWSSYNIQPADPSAAIVFADPNVKDICVANWDTNGDGELSYAEAAAVTGIPYTVFAENTNIRTFDEFQYFTGVTSLTGKYTQGDYFGSFYGCSSLESIVLPPSLQTISYGSFRECTSLAEITIPASVTTIEGLAFLGCPQLDIYMESDTPCTIVNNATNFPFSDPYAFGFTYSNEQMVKTIYVPTQECVDTYKTATNWSPYKWHIKWVGDSTPSVNPSDAIQFADANVKAICVENWDTNGDGELSFAEAAAVTDLGSGSASKFFRKTITSFDELQYFTGLTSIKIGTFFECASLNNVMIPESVNSIEEQAFSGCSSLVSVSIPSGVKSIGQQAFSGCSSLISVSIPSGLTSIGNNVFYSCSNISQVYISDLAAWCSYGIQILGSHHIYLNGNLITELVIPEGVTSIGSSAFQNCTGLTSIIIPSSVTSIGSSAFQNCTGLTSIIIPSSVTTIGYRSFYDCTGLRSLTILGSLTSVGGNAFRNCYGLRDVYISNLASWCSCDGLDISGNHQLYFNGNLITELVIPDGVTRIGSNTFSHCSGLTSVTISNSVTSIGDAAFYGCSGLTSVTISNSVTSIGGSAFYGCSGLTSVTIPSSVSSIGAKSFYNCKSLISISMGGINVPQLSSDRVFYYRQYASVDNRISVTIYVPSESLDAYKTAENWSDYATQIQAIQ